MKFAELSSTDNTGQIMGNLGRQFNKRSGKAKVWREKLFKLRREVLDLSQDDFAYITGYTKRSISRYETGEYKISNKYYVTINLAGR